MTTTLHQRRQVWDALTTYPGAGTGTLVEATGLSHNLTLNILNDLYGKGRAERRQRRAEDPSDTPPLRWWPLTPPIHVRSLTAAEGDV